MRFLSIPTFFCVCH